ncbi:MAG: paraquat-inducible protein A [Acetobacteraceae bacterium]|nr:paraquat-inducible protein A [Acetobacteraceae bacterium]
MIPPAVAIADPTVRECPGCGLFQTVPPVQPGITARCGRCGTTLRRGRAHALDWSMALTLAALVLLVIMCSATLMSVSTAGISHSIGLFAGPEELVRRNMAALALVIVFTIVLAPLGKLIGTIYVLARLREAEPPRHLRRVFLAVQRLTPWSMLEVFVFGVFVAYVKLGDSVQIGLGYGVFALLVLTFILVWADGALDREAVWAALDPLQRAAASGVPRRASGQEGEAIGCESCGLVCVPAANPSQCPRCGSVLHRRKPDSVARTWAFVIAAAILYIPANTYPVLTVVQLGAGAPSTILGGVRELIASRMYPLAALVFFASVAVPMLKLIGLSIMLVATQTGRAGWLRDRTRLYHIVRWIGRWSMIDIFMESLLGALVRFGTIITIEPGVGAIAFCSVVILTIFAAESFDPRLMWDAAQPSEPMRLALALPAPAERA